MRFLLLVAWWPVVAAADPARQSLALEAGAELDTNVHRSLADSGDVESGFAFRGAARWGIAWRPASDHGLGAVLTAAGRGLLGGAAYEENTLLLGSDLRWNARVGTGAALQVAASYHDLFEADTRVGGLDVDRDFRTGQGRIGLSLTDAAQAWRFAGSVGGRVFAFKPERSLDFAGVTAGLEVSRTVMVGEGEALVAGLSYQLAHRDFAGAARDLGCGGSCTVPTGVGRLDLFHTGSVSVEWQGDFLAAARYELAANRSNSVGQSYFRHRVDLSGTIELGDEWLCTARLVLQINRADDDPLSGPSGAVPTIEDESKSLIQLHVLHPLSKTLSLELRAAVYVGPVDALGDFSRTVVSLGVLYGQRP